MLFQQEIIVILSGAAPISEVRGAIPLGILLFGMPPLKTYLLSVLGNLLPVVPLLFFLERFSLFSMRRFYFMNRFLSWLFEYTRSRHSDHFHYWGWAPVALFVFVAIPLPLTGAWSGALVAFIFGVPLRRASLIIFLGIVSAAAVVLATTLFGITIFNSVFL
ncbi:MAG: hypothetical protein A2931_01830 [Candidatus Niyogibacteria bacterium RIFCSPLOWO2_01_FULL_45_48]|uniref:Ligand-binding protein SH3 n=2 Tax=Candidatus Niyogiibacteriota TaxID=1817912 RepID=A0A1G2F0C2_9BACT|nr:MAG: hypothetical protein A2835_01675 [Candidatus Niyogibacteria bacterium RIFCSPHIGHO2_01_FULL_45_28]OGZ30823.1 MAG: hypothetical protein A2931_01830 [Candidatus Niyogibacteria bacterium RIFCSPLOWO2_01_FULL_45_48]OGZ31192.1 MAG: hypothetical protein A3J00_01435 [Candidatus Niyogibacteria bacterium RIFCSPLOWO2_02_FULL_45_13]